MKAFYGMARIYKDELCDKYYTKEINLEYYKINHKNVEKQYGIEVIKWGLENDTKIEESKTILNITNEETVINTILDKLKENRVTPVCLAEIIEEFKFQFNN